MERTNLSKGRKRQKGSSFKYDIAFRRKVASDYREGNDSLRQVAGRYGIQYQNIQKWLKEFSFESDEQIPVDMTAEEHKELEQLKRENEALKKKLEYEQMRNFALETMADLAKTELGIDIRKNSGAKQPKK